MTVWIKELLKNLDEQVDEATRRSIMGACGEKCPFTHLTDLKLLEIKETSRDEQAFLDERCRQWHLKHEQGQYYVVFDRCYCFLVDEETMGVSKTLCFCTLGNLKRKFRIGLERDVDIEMHKTILAGDDECRFLVKLDRA